MQEAVPYVSIRTVLYDISTMLDPKEWNEANMLEWAYRALRKNKANKIYTNKVALLDVIEHKFPLPEDLRYLHQIAYKICSTTELLEDIKESIGMTDEEWDDSTIPYRALISYYNSASLNWKPLLLSSSPFALAMHCGYGLPKCTHCEHTYAVAEDFVVTTSLKEGKVLIAYLAYPQNDDGDALIPDNADLRDAIMHYCLYRHYLGRSLKAMGEDQAANQQKEWHLSMYEVLSAKSKGAIDLPTMAEYENYRRSQTRLVPRAHKANQFFLGLNNEENINYA